MTWGLGREMRVRDLPGVFGVPFQTRQMPYSASKQGGLGQLDRHGWSDRRDDRLWLFWLVFVILPFGENPVRKDPYVVQE